MSAILWIGMMVLLWAAANTRTNLWMFANLLNAALGVNCLNLIFWVEVEDPRLAVASFALVMAILALIQWKWWHRPFPMPTRISRIQVDEIEFSWACQDQTFFARLKEGGSVLTCPIFVMDSGGAARIIRAGIQDGWNPQSIGGKYPLPNDKIF